MNFAPKGFAPFKNGERDFVKADLLPGNDEYGRSSPPPEDRPQKRHPPDLLPRRVLLFSAAGFALCGLPHTKRDNCNRGGKRLFRRS
jgi:hypothetical protein